MEIGVLICESCKENKPEALLAYNSIKDHFNKDIFFEGSQKIHIDPWLFICGCSNPDFYHENLTSRSGKLFLMGEHDLEKAIHMIELIKENKDLVDI